MNGPAPVSVHPFPRRTCVVLSAAVLLVIHFLTAVGSKLYQSTTSDELVHLTAGVSYWQNNDYRLHPENGILPQRWAALPAVLGGAKVPPQSDPASWQNSNVWTLGYHFFYETSEDHFPRLMAGRAMVALFSVATGLLVFCWSRRLFGDAGGLVSLIFFAFCPTFLAHGALVTSDVSMAFFFLAATGAWWWQLHDRRAGIWWLSALTLGMAFVAKFSAVLLPPVMLILALVRALAPEPLTLGGRNFSSRFGKFCAIAVSAAGHALVVGAVVWTFYGFRYSAFNPLLPPGNQFIQPWSAVEQNLGGVGAAIHLLNRWHALPEAFLYGLAYVLKTVASRSAFLNGDYSVSGWPTFFPWTFILKTTIPLLLACLLGGCLAVKRLISDRDGWCQGFYRITPLLVLFIIYWFSSLTSHLNIGHRHLLPTYPVLFIAAGALGGWMTSRKIIQISAITALLGWHIGESICIAPYYLAYFNEIGGGPDNGWRHLVDSSLDWGQDLPALKRWLDKSGGTDPAFLAYFGTGEPDYYAIKATRMPFLNLFGKTDSWYALEPGVYCISATILQQVYSSFHAEWRAEWEKEYQEARLKEPLFREYWKNPSVRSELGQLGVSSAFEEMWLRYEKLRFARLCYYLRLRTPDATAGHSILIYRLTPAEIEGSTTGKLSDLRRLIENALAKNHAS